MACACNSRLLAFAALVLAVWLVPQPAFAAHDHDLTFAPECHSASDVDVSLQNMADRAGWTCSNTGWRADRPVAWLRFDHAAWEGEERPKYFFTRIARYKSISFAALDADGTLREINYSESDGNPFAAGPVFQLELPEVKAETRAVLVRIERPHSVPMLSEARLTFSAENADWSQLDVMLLALVVGMLVLPLFFDISFFVVLRERFVAIHAAMVVSMMGYVLFAGGLISVFVDLPVWLIAIAGPLFWAVGCGLSALFLATFVDDRALPPLLRRITVIGGLWTIVVPGFFALQLHATQAIDDRGYFVAFIPAIVLITSAVVVAVLRGSVSARFIGLAWAPIIFASAERMARGLGLYSGPSTLDQMLYIATGIEVTMISLAIGERFLALRRERDAAVTEARMMEQLSERDPLTGLMNRRAMEARFEGLRAQGFDTFALVDLDRFKDVNDRFGHQAGDQALVACAKALRSNDDPDVIAVRLGGEEFVVLMRGARALARVEAMRHAIPLHIASDVEGLDRTVTASMGVVELPRSADTLMSFHDLYARADELLYEAKAAGRNRMNFERLQVFGRRSPKPASQSAAA